MTQATIHDALRGNEFFRRFPREDLSFLAEHAKDRHIEQDRMVFRQGDRADRFYLIQKGLVDVEVPALYGPVLVIQNLGPNMMLGWSWLIAPYEWDFQAHARSTVDLIQFDGAAILERCEKDSGFGYRLLKRFTELMSERLRAARRRMMEQWNPSGFA